MRTEARLGSWTLAGAGAAVLMTQAFQPTVLAAVWAGETAAWIVTLLSGILATLLLWPTAATLAKMPDGHLVHLGRSAAGEVGLIATGLLICGLLTYEAGMVLRQTSEQTVSAVYPHTPQTFSMVVLSLGTLYGAMGGLRGLITLNRTFLPLLGVAIALILAGAFGWLRPIHLLPFWGSGITTLPARSILPSTMYVPALFMLVAAGEIRDRKHLGRAVGIAALGACLALAVTSAAVVMAYPYPLARGITFPLHELSRLILGGRFFERLDGLWVLVWVYGTIAHLASLVYAAARTFCDVFGWQSHRPAVPPLVFIAITVALFPIDQMEAILWPRYGAPYALIIGLVLPFVLAMVTRWRKRGQSYEA